MTRNLRLVVLVCALASVLWAPARAQISDEAVRIGFITDMSGPYADIDGPAGVEAIRSAILDAGGQIQGKPIELLVFDHRNEADRAAAQAREWFERNGLDMLIAGTHSGAALAMARVAAEKKKPLFVVGAATARLTNEACTPYTVHYAYDTVALAKGTGSAVVKAGGQTWFFITADYAFGTALEADTAMVVKTAGGKVLGAARHPLATRDFSAALQSAQASRAQILGLANAGSDARHAIQAARASGVTRSMRVAALLMFLHDVHALGLDAAQGMYLTDSWYWNQSAETRAWSRRFYQKIRRMPSSLHAADYSAAYQYLAAVKAAETDDAEKVLARLRKTRVNDMYIKNGFLRADGRMVHDMYLMQVKAPHQSKEPWDYYNVVRTIPGEAAWTTAAESRCGLWRRR